MRRSHMSSSMEELELELAVLKQKRMILEQEQQMLNNDYSRRVRPYDYNYEQPRQSTYRSERRGFRATLNPWESFYDQPGSSDSDRQFGKKRQVADDDWNHNIQAKRFSGTRRGSSSNKYESRFDSRPLPSPKSNTDPQPYNNRKSFRPPAKSKRSEPRIPFHKDVKPVRSRVSKTKSNDSPNNLNSYPTKERRNLVADASKFTKTADSTDMVLRANQVLSKKMNSILEGTLGDILRELKTKYSKAVEYEKLFNGPEIRIIKQAIRDRLRCAMLGKVVGRVSENVKHYRKMFPEEKDKEILEIAAKAALIAAKDHKNTVKLTEPESIQDYFKNNISRLLEVKLEEMLIKLKNLCQKDYENNEKSEDVDKKKAADIEKHDAVDNKQDKNLSNINCEIQADIDQEIQVNNDTKENALDDVINSTHDDIKECNDEELKENAVDDVIDDTTDGVKESTGNDIKESTTDKLTKNTAGNTNNSKLSPENDEEPQISTFDDLECDIDIYRTYKAWKYHNNVFFRPFYFKKIMMTTLIDNKIEKLLAQPKYKEIIKDIINTDEAYKVNKMEILNQTKNKIGHSYKVDVSDVNVDLDTPDHPMPKKYYVKVFGRPHLPQTQIMKDFMDKFQPVYIKKHKRPGKKSSNLLFLTFGNEQDYQNILAANGTTIGDITLTVIDSNQSLPKPELTKTEEIKNDNEIIDDQVCDTLNDSLNSSLVDQINDLISMIKNDEDEPTSDTKDKGEELPNIESKLEIETEIKNDILKEHISNTKFEANVGDEENASKQEKMTDC